MKPDIACDCPNHHAQDAIVDLAAQGGANCLYLAEIEFRPAELAIAGTRFVEGETLRRLEQFRQECGKFLKSVFAAVAEQPVGQAEQARLGGHGVFQRALNGTAELLRSEEHTSE